VVEPVRTEIDGVPTVWAQLDKPFRAGLVFRAGKCDESLRTSGISHFVEHLALSTIGKRPFGVNGFVDGTRTVFLASGEPEEVATFLRDICSAIMALPLDRVALERQVLLAEARGHRSVFVTTLLFARYGFTGLGLMDPPEFGLRWLTGEAVIQWAADRFTADNAALWLSGPPPPGLSLPLPKGSRWNLPEPIIPDPNLELPAYWVREDPQTAIGWIWDRTPVTALAQDMLMERLTEELRHGEGLIYAPLTSSMLLTRETNHFSVGVDAAPGVSERVRDGVLRVIDDLSTAGPRPDEMAHSVELRRRVAGLDDWAAGDLDSMATGLLLGSDPIEGASEETQELARLQPEDVAEVLHGARDSWIVIGPRWEEPPADRFSLFPTHSTDRVLGRAYAALEPKPTRRRLSLRKETTPRETLYVGLAGVSTVSPAGRMATVRYERCAAVVEERDGSRGVLGLDGIGLYVDPRKWTDGADAVAYIDETRPADLVVPPPPEPDESEPRAEPAQMP